MVISGLRLKAHSYIFVAQMSPFRLLVPGWTDIPWVIYGNSHAYQRKYSEYQQAGKDAYLQVSVTDPARPCCFVADPEAIKEITRPRAPFIKNITNARAMSGMFQPNLAMLEGEDWKQHRKVTQHAFTEKNLQLVCTETVTALEQLFTIWDKNYGQRVHVPDVSHITKTLALMVVSSAAFGQRLTWIEDTERPEPGFDVSFHKAILIVSRSLIKRRMTPRWAETWTQANRDMAFGFSELKRYLHRMIAAHREEGSSAGGSTATGSTYDNLFNVLMRASKEDQAEEGDGLSDEAVSGNVFVFLIAGHETTANMLLFSLGLLALYPETQQEAYLQVKRAMAPDGGLTYVNLRDLKLMTGILYETLRMYPPVLQMLQIAEHDATISIARNIPGTDQHTREKLFVPANSHVVLSIIGTHYNPRYWPEPEEFRPSRFSEPYNKDAFVPWLNGRRTCIGQKFAETEGIAALATILARYEVTVDQSKFSTIPGESINARRERLLRPAHLIMSAPEKLPLVFTRR
ncbi:cytochrome P450 [Ceratobasidium sp. AG-I]|nr:cytochrome P450 [Ceratobasidium sp. AG-I]